MGVSGAALLSTYDDLMQGVDRRGHSPYGLPPLAGDDLVAFGSCTANPVTADTLARWRELEAKGGGLDPELTLQLLYGAAQCRLAASGTDAEYTCALAMGPQPYCTVLMDPGEIGSGCVQAAVGRAHAAGGPVTQPLPVQATPATVSLRDAAGRPLAQAAVDRQVFDIVQTLGDLPLLLHHVPCSKTGLAAPSEAACLQVQRGHAAGARVVVDASQGRFHHDDVRRWLAHGWAVIVTGSKFFGAPPFCGATLLPPGWPRAQGFGVGPGLRGRWRLALQDWSAQAPRGDGSDLLQAVFVPALRRAGIAIDADAGGACARQGILSFDAGLDAAATRRLHRRLIARGWFLGQPVAAGSRHLLRVALGARTRPGRAASDLDRLARVLLDELVHG